ncbi:MFS transporter [Nocardia wallacei]|uniref:MFS transporter n=1 Tax=Nocardia wallacei TaxID=480035 RepID=UPI002456B025|nr:MFS transporter [Nocardia wallacei]
MIVLALAALVFYTDDYVIAGVLPEIAGDLDVGVGVAGQLVTVFSLTVAVAAPVAAIVLSRRQPRSVLAAATGVFAGANLVAAVTPSFSVLICARVLAALAAAAATPSIFALAARLSPPERLGRYLAIVTFGVTGSIAVGVPLGTWLSAIGGWRATFGAMAVGGALVLLGFLTQLPSRAELGAVQPVSAQMRVLASPRVSVGLAANIVLMFGSMMLLTYLSSFVDEVSAATIGVRGVVFAVSGVAGMAGIWAGGHAVDRWGPDRALATGVLVFVVTMLAFAGMWVLRPVPVAVLYPLVMLWCGAAFWNSPATQARLHLLAGETATQALALNTSGTYIGVAVGGVVGGVIVGTVGPGLLPIAAVGAGVGTLLLFHLAARLAPVHYETTPG